LQGWYRHFFKQAIPGLGKRDAAAGNPKPRGLGPDEGKDDKGVALAGRLGAPSGASGEAPRGEAAAGAGGAAGRSQLDSLVVRLW